MDVGFEDVQAESNVMCGYRGQVNPSVFRTGALCYHRLCGEL